MGVEELVEELLIVHDNLNTAFINQYLCICGWEDTGEICMGYDRV